MEDGEIADKYDAQSETNDESNAEYDPSFEWPLELSNAPLDDIQSPSGQ
jgi:hypothetical protein